MKELQIKESKAGKRASRGFPRLEAKNLRGIYKFSFTNVILLYLIIGFFQIFF
jgi:hypothetical protein